MNLVIADDFTGAAELAGIGLRFGLKQEVRQKIDYSNHLDTIILNTDTRSKNAQEATAILESFLGKLSRTKFSFLYKKTDSVLRGHVRLELELIARYLNYSRIILVPANPSRKRIIKDGIFYIENKPLHQTDFAQGFIDNLFEGRVLPLLGENGTFPIYVIPLGQKIPENGIIVGECQTLEDIKGWVEQVDQNTLPAGGADFYTLLLEKFYSGQKKTSDISQHPSFSTFANQRMLFVLGSTSQYSRQFLGRMQSTGVAICSFPVPLTSTSVQDREVFNQWQNCVKQAMQTHRVVAIAIGQTIVRDRTISRALSGMISQIVASVMKHSPPDVLLIEGGSTASAIFHHLKADIFLPVQEFAPGIVQLQIKGVETPQIVVKPGSYAWPEGILNEMIST